MSRHEGLPPRDLLQAQLDGRVRSTEGFVGRIARWLSRDARALDQLDRELEFQRLTQLHEMERLRDLLDAGSFGVVGQALAMEPGIELLADEPGRTR